jgi:hypothetical protein
MLLHDHVFVGRTVELLLQVLQFSLQLDLGFGQTVTLLFSVSQTLAQLFDVLLLLCMVIFIAIY